LIGGTEANFWRIAFATVVLGIWAFVFGKGLSGSAFPTFLMSGVVGIGLGDVAYFQALPWLGPRLSLLLVQCLTAPFAALMEWGWLGTTLTGRQILFGLTILAGVGLALTPGEHLNLTRRQLTVGTLSAVLAAVGGAGGAVLSRKAYAILQANGEQIDGITAGFQRVIGGLFLAGLALLIVKRSALRLQLSAQESATATAEKWRAVWFWILLNSLAGQTLGVSCMLWALETTPTGVVLPIIAMSPIAVIPLAWIFEGERPTIHSLLGGAIAVAGVIGLTLAR
jgi:drug/metabolite transporter (DMT)-like permease